MSTSQLEHLISMINQIASNNCYKKSDEETAGFVANHLKMFWAVSMQDKLLQYMKDDGVELSNASKIALRSIK
jgi:formate dehydrogenase subunit delta